jgi:hypothetical protein
VVVFLKARVVDKIAGRDDEVGRRREAVELAYTCSKRRGRAIRVTLLQILMAAPKIWLRRGPNSKRCGPFVFAAVRAAGDEAGAPRANPTNTGALGKTEPASPGRSGTGAASSACG